MTFTPERWLDPELKKKRRRNVLIGTLIILVLFMAWAIGAYRHTNEKRTKCVELPSGMLLGYYAVFDKRRFFTPSDNYSVFPLVGPKYADGTPLIEDSIEYLFVSERSLYGWTKYVGGGDYRFAWSVDDGLVYGHKNPELYKRIAAETGQENFVYGATHRGTRIVFRDLVDSGKFELIPCETRLYAGFGDQSD